MYNGTIVRYFRIIRIPWISIMNKSGFFVDPMPWQVKVCRKFNDEFLTRAVVPDVNSCFNTLHRHGKVCWHLTIHQAIKNMMTAQTIPTPRFLSHVNSSDHGFPMAWSQDIETKICFAPCFFYVNLFNNVAKIPFVDTWYHIQMKCIWTRHLVGEEDEMTIGRALIYDNEIFKSRVIRECVSLCGTEPMLFQESHHQVHGGLLVMIRAKIGFASSRSIFPANIHVAENVPETLSVSK